MPKVGSRVVSGTGCPDPRLKKVGQWRAPPDHSLRLLGAGTRPRVCEPVLPAWNREQQHRGRHLGLQLVAQRGVFLFVSLELVAVQWCCLEGPRGWEAQGSSRWRRGEGSDEVRCAARGARGALSRGHLLTRTAQPPGAAAAVCPWRQDGKSVWVGSGLGLAGPVGVSACAGPREAGLAKLRARRSCYRQLWFFAPTVLVMCPWCTV